MIKRTIVCLVLSLIAKPALAASVISVNCEITNSGNTDVFVLLDPAPTSSAVVSINGTEQAGTHSLNGPEISVQATGEVECGTATITVTDGATVYTGP